MKNFSLYIFFSLLILSLFFSCKYEADNSLKYEITKSWLGELDPETKLVELSIPATHDSAALMDFMLPDVSNNQNTNIKEQLEMGVRFLDLRIHKNPDGTLGLYHGIKYMYINLDEVFEIVTSFLKENPTEFVFCMIKEEVFLSSGDGKSFSRDIDSLFLSPSFSSFFYISENNKFPETIKEAQGKIIVLKNYLGSEEENIGLEMMSKNTSLDFVNIGSGYYIPYESSNIVINSAEDKWNWAEKEIDKMLSNPPTKLQMLNLNAYKKGPFGLPDIASVAKVINKNLIKKLNFLTESGIKSPIGLIYVDKIDADLSYAIIKMNKNID